MSMAKVDSTRKFFDSAPVPDEEKWLGWDQLDELFRQYHKPEKYSYDPDAVEKRGRERAEEILAALPSDFKKGGLKTLEIGALDAMASYFLWKVGFSPTAFDLTDSHFKGKVLDADIECHVMSATDLSYEDNSFDLAFSYNAFEHIDDPDKALSEAIRVVKPGGYIYLNFGPLYFSPMGLHAHESIPVPYCQFLFETHLLQKYCDENNLGTIEFDTMNGWPASRFRTTFEKYRDKLIIENYGERREIYGLELVEKFTQCFRGKVEKFDDLTISAIEVLIRVK